MTIRKGFILRNGDRLLLYSPSFVDRGGGLYFRNAGGQGEPTGCSSSAGVINSNELPPRPFIVPNQTTLIVRKLDANKNPIEKEANIKYGDTVILQCAAAPDNYLIANQGGFVTSLCLCGLAGNMPYFERPSSSGCSQQDESCFGRRNWSYWTFRKCRGRDEYVRYGDVSQLVGYNGTNLIAGWSEVGFRPGAACVSGQSPCSEPTQVFEIRLPNDLSTWTFDVPGKCNPGETLLQGYCIAQSVPGQAGDLKTLGDYFKRYSTYSIIILIGIIVLYVAIRAAVRA